MDLHARDVTSADGTRVRLWERSPPDAGEAVLFVHGATYPGRAVFDLQVPGAANYSWLRATAEAGRAAFAVDVRGYGDSERPGLIEGTPDPVSPDAVPARASTAAEDARAALAHLRERFDRVHLVGYSWGTITCGTLLTSPDPPRVASLTQFAPAFRRTEDEGGDVGLGDPPAPYRTVTREDVAARWNDPIPGDPAAHRGGGPDDPVLAAFWETLVTSGQGEADGERVRAPNGTLLDLREAVGAEPYPAGEITVPALVVRGSLDATVPRAPALRLYDALGATDDRKEYAEIAGGTHFLQLERRREALYRAVGAFHDRVGDR